MQKAPHYTQFLQKLPDDDGNERKTHAHSANFGSLPPSLRHSSSFTFRDTRRKMCFISTAARDGSITLHNRPLLVLTVPLNGL